MELLCTVQNYAWGKIGEESEVAQLVNNIDAGITIDPKKPYAELWMGVHPSGPSIIRVTNEKLSEWIQINQQSIGDKVRKQFGVQLPYLFKVLSVNKALSIQAHPTKEHAEKLHTEHPELYKDPNHKPEMAIALTPFEALCGFRPIDEIKRNLEVAWQHTVNVGNDLDENFCIIGCSCNPLPYIGGGQPGLPELAAIVGEESVSQLLSSKESGLPSSLKKCFSAVMTCSEDKVKLQLQLLLKRLSIMDESSREQVHAKLFERIHTQFPGDVGCFGVYFFNYLVLQPGEAMFLGPNEPHAYLFGDCIECMACSDNVVRAGLTPKFKDVDTLCNMLTYKCEPAEAKKFKGKKEDEFCTLFSPPVPDFAVAKIEIPPGNPDYSTIPRDSATISIVISGEATSDTVILKRGVVFFLSASQTLKIHITGETPLLMFQALGNV